MRNDRILEHLQQKCILSRFQRPEVRDQGVGRAALPPEAPGEAPFLHLPTPGGPSIPWVVFPSLGCVSDPCLCLICLEGHLPPDLGPSQDDHISRSFPASEGLYFLVQSHSFRGPGHWDEDLAPPHLPYSWGNPLKMEGEACGLNGNAPGTGCGQAGWEGQAPPGSPTARPRACSPSLPPGHGTVSSLWPSGAGVGGWLGMAV